LHSYIALPLITGGSVIGVMGMHTFEVDFFDGEELKLLEELAADISFALEYIEKEERVVDLAYNEPLTHLPNRVSLQRALASAVEEAAAKAHTIGLVLMDLDNFRDINNSLGHANGDLLLQHVARTVRESLWESDRIASLGGDEFAILLPRLGDKDDIQLVLEKIRVALQKPLSLTGVPVNIEYALGIALYPEHGDTADLLWQHADVALTTAKERHETHLFYSSDFDHYDPQRLALIGELRDAIHAEQLIVHFQPIIGVAGGKTTAVEALVRWQHPARGLIFPDQFIPLAERTGLINPLTACVVAEALRSGNRLHQEGFPLTVSVNLSARNLHDADFSAKLLDLVGKSGFPRERLILEITESAIMDDPIRARKVLNNLHDAGIQLSMDDFGIGHSSLSYLKDLPISRIKIDKSFLIGYWQPRNSAIVRSAIELARNLELKVTAEGVEDEATYLELRKLGCDLAQGYYFSKPLPPDRLRDWLRNSGWK
jgi:diguanylate cyclase (GGDEF)-like protein